MTVLERLRAETADFVAHGTAVLIIVYYIRYTPHQFARQGIARFRISCDLSSFHR
jgi:hypothetical protein